MFGATFGGDTAASAAWSAAPADASSPRAVRRLVRRGRRRPARRLPGLRRRVTRVVVDRGELTLHVRPGRVADVCRHLRDDADQRYELLLGVSGRRLPRPAERFHVVYHLLSMTYRRRMRLETQVPLEHPHVATRHRRLPDGRLPRARDVGHVRRRLRRPPGADPHPHARTTGTGHPQRKDYPLGGVPVEYKGAQIPPPDERRSYA
jgi:NADH-quinone oxidoreductase subunit C